MRRVGAIQVCGAIACALVLLGCSGDSATPAQACVPGDAKVCPCTNGESGAQSCSRDGSGYEPCVCTVGSTPSGTFSGADATGSSGSSSLGDVLSPPTERPADVSSPPTRRPADATTSEDTAAAGPVSDTLGPVDDTGTTSEVITTPDATGTGTDASSPSVPSEYVLIPAGTFTMGSPESEPCRWEKEIEHQVTLTGSFWLKTTEVTQGEWEALMGNNPS